MRARPATIALAGSLAAALSATLPVLLPGSPTGSGAAFAQDAAAPEEPADQGPSFDCQAAESDAEALVCEDPDLAAIDRELARLYALAEAAESGDGLAILRATQRGWIRGRDDCWKAAGTLADCVRDTYALRIAELRQGYAAARAGDGPSAGPYPYVCEGLDVPLSTTFVDAGTSLVVVEQGEIAVTLPLAPAASGARYAGQTYAGPMEFWADGDGALFTPAGGETYACTRDVTG